MPADRLSVFAGDLPAQPDKGEQTPISAPQLPQHLPPLLLTIQQLAVLLSRSVAALERDDSAGRIPRPQRIGRAKRWRVAEISDWVEAGCPSRREWEARRRNQR